MILFKYPIDILALFCRLTLGGELNKDAHIKLFVGDARMIKYLL